MRAPGTYEQRSPFADVTLGSDESGRALQLAAALERAGISIARSDDEPTLLWDKLAMLAPFALTTSATGRPIGDIQSDPGLLEGLHECCREACRVARAEGAATDAEGVVAALDRLPAATRSSMQNDLEAGRPLELDAIGGAIIRRGRLHGVPTPTTRRLAAEVERRWRARRT